MRCLILYDGTKEAAPIANRNLVIDFATRLNQRLIYSPKKKKRERERKEGRRKGRKGGRGGRGGRGAGRGGGRGGGREGGRREEGKKLVCSYYWEKEYQNC